MTGDEKKKRDPIFTVCFVVFILAAVSVVGVYIDEHYLTEDTTKAAYGDQVTVNYTGTFYAYYGEENAVVFDTSYRSIGENDTIIKSNSFNKSSYSTLSFEVGGNKVLTEFGNAVVGHKVGDKIQVTIQNGYPAGSDFYTQSTHGLTVPIVQEMTVAQFEDLYDYNLTDGGMTYIDSTVYGWPATAYSADNKVYITNMPEAGQTYTYTPNGEVSDGDEETADDGHSFGTTTFTVTSTDNGGNIVFDIAFSETTSVGDNGDIQMIQLEFGTETWYVTNVSNGEFTYKTCDEVSNATLYFEIEIVSIE